MLSHSWPIFLVLIVVFGGTAFRWISAFVSAFSSGAVGDALTEVVERRVEVRREHLASDDPELAELEALEARVSAAARSGDARGVIEALREATELSTTVAAPPPLPVPVAHKPQVEHVRERKPHRARPGERLSPLPALEPSRAQAAHRARAALQPLAPLSPHAR